MCCSTGKGSWRRVVVFTTLMLGVLVAGCSSFNRNWKAAEKINYDSSGLAGRWEGRWLSDVNGHNGKLRCLITREKDSVYQARFRAHYAKIFRFSYTVPLMAEPASDGFKFDGEADLGGLAGGVYSYTGHANATNFFSTYSSKHDHGTFQMKRVF